MAMSALLMSDMMFKSSSTIRLLKDIAFISSAIFILTGCKLNETPEDVYEPAAYYERYPIDVKKAPITVNIASSSKPLQREQVATISRLASSARDAATTNISVKRPSASRTSETSEQIIKVLLANGIARSKITEGTYPGGATAPVAVSFTRSVAITKECGDWSRDMTNIPNDREYPNFGCAYQNNIAAMVSNPEDLVVPRPTTMVSASTRKDGGSEAAADTGGQAGGGSGAGGGGDGGGGGAEQTN